MNKEKIKELLDEASQKIEEAKEELNSDTDGGDHSGALNLIGPIGADIEAEEEVVLEWSGPEGAKYDIRADDLSDPSLSMEGNNCGVNKHYMCRNQYSGTSFSMPVKKGHEYRWWIHIYPSAIWKEARFSVKEDGGVVDPPTYPTDKVRGLMLTDAMCDKELAKYREDDLIKLKGKYNTILTLADLQKDGPKPTRKYVDWARNKGKLTDLGLKNLNWLHSQGFRVHVILLNSWGAKHGYSGQMGSVQDPIRDEASLYTSSQFEIEKDFIDDLLDKAPFIEGIMPVLEGQHRNSIPFSMNIARYLRDEKDFKGRIIFNIIGEFEGVLKQQNLLSQYGILKSSSQNNSSSWVSSDNDIRNSDGMMDVSSSNPDLITFLTENPGPKGYYLWAKELVGSASGRTLDIPPEYATAVSGGSGDGGEDTPPEDDDPVVNPPDNTGSVPDWDGATQDASKKSYMLWKPISESDGKLVVLVKWDQKSIKRIALRTGWLSPEFEIGNGTGDYHDGRSIYRFDKSGGEYSSPVYLSITMTNSDAYIFEIPKPVNRYDMAIAPWYFPSGGSGGSSGGGNNDTGPSLPPVGNGHSIKRVFVHREQSAAHNLGIKNAVTIAKSGIVGDTIRLYPLYRDKPAPSLDWFEAQMAKAKKEGCIGYAVDLEGAIIRKGPVYCANIYKRAKKVGIPFWWEPKVFSGDGSEPAGHLTRHWKYSYEGGVQWLQNNSDGIIFWLYAWGADQWMNVFKKLRADGLTVPLIPLGDAIKRTTGGQWTTPFSASDVQKFHRYNYGVGFFVPGSITSMSMKTEGVKQATKIY